MSHNRFVPWVIACVFAAVLLVGVTWDATYESKPADGDNIAAGAGEIRSLRVETRDRSEEEHCFGSGGGSTCTVDSGFHRLGSARAFHGNGVPGFLANPASTALGSANDIGRMWIDANGADGVGSTIDDSQLFVWSGSAWVAVTTPPFVDTDGPDNSAGNIDDNALSVWNGAAFVAVRVPQPTLVNSATVNNDQVLDFATLDTVPVDLAMTGGAGAGGIPMVTTLGAGTWDIQVDGAVVLSEEAASAKVDEMHIVKLQEQIGAGAFTTVAWCTYLYPNSGGVPADAAYHCQFSYTRLGAAVSTAYSYRMRVAATTNAAALGDLRADSTQAGDQLDAESPDDGFITAVATAR